MSTIRNTTEDMKDPAEQLLMLAIGMSNKGNGNPLVGTVTSAGACRSHGGLGALDRERPDVELHAVLGGEPEPVAGAGQVDG